MAGLSRPRYISEVPRIGYGMRVVIRCRSAEMSQLPNVSSRAQNTLPPATRKRLGIKAAIACQEQAQ